MVPFILHLGPATGLNPSPETVMTPPFPSDGPDLGKALWTE